MKLPLNFRHIRAFLAVMESGGVTKAADSLYIAQSAITRSIKSLESTLGVPLFERKANGMLPTVFGNTLLFRAQRAATELKDAKAKLLPILKEKNGSTNAPVFSLLYNEQRLICYVTLVELHHMPTVARVLKISQPAVSSSISQLEASLRIPLFHRTTKGMMPTEEGEILAFHAKRALTELRLVDDDISALRGTLQGTVTVGALPLSRSVILPRAIAEVVKNHPLLRIATVEGPFEQLEVGLRSADIDFIIGALRAGEGTNDLIGEPLLDDHMSLAVRVDHPLTRLKNITIEDVLPMQWVLSRKGTPARTLFDLSFTKLNVKPPEPVVETSDHTLLRGLLLNSDMVTAISSQQLFYERQSGLLTVLDFEFQHTTRSIGIMSRAGSYPSPGSVVLMEAIRKYSAELQAESMTMRGQKSKTPKIAK